MSQEGWRIENKAQLIRSINKINTQMNSQKLRQHAQGLHGFVLDMGPRAKRRRGHTAPP